MTAPAASAAVRSGPPETPAVDLDALLAPAAAVGALVLAVSSTGSMVVAAVLVGVATRSRWCGIAAVLAVAASTVRFSSSTFDDLAGIQSVLGAAVVVGPPVAAASAFAATIAVLLTARSLRHPSHPGGLPGGRVVRHLPATASGVLAATIAAGPGPGGLVVRGVATIAAVAIAVAISLLDGRPSLAARRAPVAVVAGALAVVLACWPG